MLLQLFQVFNNEICTLTITCNLFLKLNMLTMRKGRKYSKMFSFSSAWILIFLYFNMEIKWKKFTWVIAVNISLALNLRIKEKKIYSCQRHSQKTNSNSTQGYINSKLCFHSGPLLLLFFCLWKSNSCGFLCAFRE